MRTNWIISTENDDSENCQRSFLNSNFVCFFCVLFLFSLLHVFSIFGVYKVLLEKILRSVDVNRVYVLLRGKRELSPSERLKKLLNSQPFTFHDKTILNSYKVIAVEGDLTSPNLGIDLDTFEKLKNEVNIVIHCAADVRFDSDLE